MLTASLQSTWETQRSRQARPKYLQSNPYGDDSSESKGYGSDEKNGTQRGYGNARDMSLNGSTDLPNLRIPSVSASLSLVRSVELAYVKVLVRNYRL